MVIPKASLGLVVGDDVDAISLAFWCLIPGAAAVMKGAVTTPDEIRFVPEDYFRRLRPEEIFPGASERPLEVDLGCGEGSFLVGMAENFPERTFLGVERLLGRVRKVCCRAVKLGLDNLRVLRLESAYTVEWLLPEASVSRVHLLFPDPWPKKRHHRRRIVTTDFLGRIGGILVPEGEFIFKTDDPEYFEVASSVAEGAEGFEVLDWYPEGEPYAETDFEAQWKREGKDIHALRCRKVC